MKNSNHAEKHIWKSFFLYSLSMTLNMDKSSDIKQWLLFAFEVMRI